MAVLVLDFDGTLTDAEAEGRAFRDGYLEDLAVLVGRPPNDIEIRELAAEVEVEISRAPERHAFRWAEREVAPANVDPFLRMVPIANRILDRFGVLTSPVERGRLLSGVLYKYNYAKTLGHTVFRPGAGRAAQSLANTNTWIVTNSDAKQVATKVMALAQEVPGVAWLCGRVQGNARKFEIDDSWTGAPAELNLAGLERPVLLRRSKYHALLRTVLDGSGASFEDLVVVGDIFELDLALPLAMGARVGLVVSGHTPPYEQAYVDAHPRGKLIRDLSEIRPFAFGAA
ncbi:MAG: hypothetical protein AB7P03_07460 [Kofleriaceae bacterium]